MTQPALAEALPAPINSWLSTLGQGQTIVFRPQEATVVRPRWFTAGREEWHRLSQCFLALQEAIMQDLDWLVFTDQGVQWVPNLEERWSILQPEIPEDWDQFYLGGEHSITRPPGPNVITGTHVVPAKGVTKLHAWAVRKKAFGLVQRHLLEVEKYITKPQWTAGQQLALAQQKNLIKAYAPDWWLAGKQAPRCGLDGRLETNWWPWEGWCQNLPFVHLPTETCTASLGDAAALLHPGYCRREGTLEDLGLAACVQNPGQLLPWLQMVARESLLVGKLPAWQHPLISPKQVHSLWPGGVVDWSEQGVAGIQEISSYPANQLLKHHSGAKSTTALPLGPLCIHII